MQILFSSITDPGTPSGSLPKTSSIKSRESLKEGSSNPQLLMLKKDLEKESKKNKELKQSVDDKAKIIIKLESERDSLENEKAVFETEKKVKSL